MIKPTDISVEEWAKRYRIPIDESDKCPRCGCTIILEVPFATQGHRGVMSKDHGCGPRYIWKRLVPIDEKERLSLAKLYEELKEKLTDGPS